MRKYIELPTELSELNAHQSIPLKNARNAFFSSFNQQDYLELNRKPIEKESLRRRV